MPKPALADLHKAICRLLDIPNIAQYTQINRPLEEGAFEVYVFSLVLDAVKEAGGKWKMRGRNSNPHPIVFRGGPGEMASADQNFAYAHCTFPSGKSLEVHLGVQYVGTSGATHEVDISLYEASAASQARNNGEHPDQKHLIGVIECKCYSNPIGAVLARAFVGLLDDCNNYHFAALVSNSPGEQVKKYLSLAHRPDPFLEMDLLTHHHRYERRFFWFVTNKLRKWSA
jgi:hypothetical protein